MGSSRKSHYSKLIAICVAAASISPAIAGEAPTIPAQNFEFREVVAGVEGLQLKTFGECKAVPDQKDVVRCMTAESGAGDVAGENLKWAAAHLWKGRLSNLFGVFGADSFVKIGAAFQVKYGSPCGSETKDLHNMMGATVHNEMRTWCFATGKLVLAQYFNNIEEGYFLYTDEWKAPAKPPRVNF